MEILYFIPKDKYSQARDKLLRDDKISRGSISFRDAKTLGIDKEGFFCYISGTEEVCKEAEKVLSELGEVVENRDAILEKIKQDENAAMEGFGNIFG